MPQSVNVTSLTSTNITISWERVKCIERNSNVTGYVVTYSRTEDGNDLARAAGNPEMSTIIGTDPGNRIFTATGLIPRTSYTFSVSAMNSDNQNGVSISTTGSTSTPEG